LSKQPEEKIRLYFSDGDFSPAEVAEITDAFNKIAPTQGCPNAQICLDSAESNIVQTVFIEIVVFVGLEILKGFFNSMGSDLKDKLVRTLKNKKQTPVLRFDIFEKNVRVNIVAHPKNNQEWDRVFDTIGKATELAKNRIEEYSEVHWASITYDVNYAGYWNVEVLGDK
jgi:hypothetical protein